MLRSLILSFAFVLNFIGNPVLGKLARGIVGDDVKLTASENCPDRDVFELTTGKEPVKTLARRVDGLWTAAPGGPFIGRVEHHAASSLILTNLNFKDNRHVVFVCNGDDLNTVQLEVLVPHIRKVTEGETAALYCYSSTEKQVKWFKQGGKIRVRDAFSKDFSPKEDETSPGSYPLILEKVRLEDQGVYICCWESCDAPMASKLILNPTPSQTTSPPSPQCNTTQSHNEGNEMRPSEIISWVLVAVLGAAGIGLAILLYLEKKKGRKPKKSPEQNGNGEQTGMELLGCSNNHTDSNANNHKKH